uniref:Uncharacterized protein n=1 Tax=Helianthus annuus TaxID=4232 RepID=A0A251SBU4_HELAN
MKPPPEPQIGARIGTRLVNLFISVDSLFFCHIIERFATLVPPEGLLTISPSQLKLVSFVEASQSYSCVTYKKPQTQPMIVTDESSRIA